MSEVYVGKIRRGAMPCNIYTRGGRFEYSCGRVSTVHHTSLVLNDARVLLSPYLIAIWSKILGQNYIANLCLLYVSML